MMKIIKIILSATMHSLLDPRGQRGIPTHISSPSEDGHNMIPQIHKRVELLYFEVCQKAKKLIDLRDEDKVPRAVYQVFGCQ